MQNLKQIETISLIALIFAILSLPLYILVYSQKQNKQTDLQKAHFVGSDKCIECHRQEYLSWANSHHAKAMNHANDSSVLGNFNNKTIRYNDIVHRLYKKNNKFYAFTDGADGKQQEFEIKYVFGFYPLQQYLVEFPGGRLQCLPLTWDSKNKKWYHMAETTYPKQIIEHNNWLHWTNQAQNWNSMCADCHSTNVVKGYDVASDTYHTTFSEINVGCEACHGPSSLHIKWAEQSQYSYADDNYGLTVKTSNIDNQAYVDLCLRCHSRRTAISDFNHHANVYNHSIVELPNGENYFIDGQILNEDYVYASFTQSKMFMRDVKCNDCHNVHSNKLLFDDNRLCTQCHRADDYDTYKHHFHKYKGENGEAVIASDGVKFDVGEGTRCINCHAPARFYMGVDYRNDHSFRVPRPDLSDTLNSPNACNHCHADKSTKWASKYIEKWHGLSKKSQYGTVFKSAENSDHRAFDDLVKIYNDEVYPPIIRATALRYLGRYFQNKSKAILFDACLNVNTQIRFNALQNLQITDAASFNQVLELLDDKTKAIRIECANKLMVINANEIPEKYNQKLESANNERFASLEYNADFPSGKFNLANYYYNTGKFDKAEEFYLKCLKQDNELHTVKINLALLYNNIGKYDKAELLFKDYLQHFKDDGNITFSYALFLSERKRYKESMQYLLRAAKLLPYNTRILYNTAMMYDFENNFIKAEEFLNKAISIENNNRQFYIALLNLYKKYDKAQQFNATRKQIVDKFGS